MKIQALSKRLLSSSIGLTLLEVVVSMAILMFGTMGLIGLMAYSKKQFYLSLNKEYLSIENQSLFENIGMYEDLKKYKSFGLDSCEPITDKKNIIILNRNNICERLKHNLGEPGFSLKREIILEDTELQGKKVNIKIVNYNDKKTYIYSKVFAVK
jgi:hypothetical protein